MPYINIKLAGTLNRDQKEIIAKEITQLVEKVAHKPASYTYLVFDEVKGEDWPGGGRLLG